MSLPWFGVVSFVGSFFCVRGSASLDRVLVLGDSHARVFDDAVFRRWELDVHAVRGASAYGLKNPDSVTGASREFRQVLKNSPAGRVILLLGGVDTDFLIWHRAATTGRSFETCREESLLAYADFLREVLETRSAGDVLCISAPLPAVSDRQRQAMPARMATATQRERTELVLVFNRRMQAFCRPRGIRYLNLDSDSLGQDGFVLRKLLRRNPCDHHYRRRAYAQLIASRLRRSSFALSANPPSHA